MKVEIIHHTHKQFSFIGGVPTGLSSLLPKTEKGGEGEKKEKEEEAEKEQREKEGEEKREEEEEEEVRSI